MKVSIKKQVVGQVVGQGQRQLGCWTKKKTYKLT